MFTDIVVSYKEYGFMYAMGVAIKKTKKKREKSKVLYTYIQRAAYRLSEGKGGGGRMK